MDKEIWIDGIMGLVIGDACGVPVEFKSRFDLKKDPVVDMREYGTHGQPRGTWSDDSSMALATLASLHHLNGENVLFRRTGFWIYVILIWRTFKFVL